ncbi:MAG: hypothetical protein AAGA75_07610 [Cyanobacteria bacterium P01_E01_bin.6]
MPNIGYRLRNYHVLSHSQHGDAEVLPTTLNGVSQSTVGIDYWH